MFEERLGLAIAALSDVDGGEVLLGAGDIAIVIAAGGAEDGEGAGVGFFGFCKEAGGIIERAEIVEGPGEVETCVALGRAPKIDGAFEGAFGCEEFALLFEDDAVFVPQARSEGGRGEAQRGDGQRGGFVELALGAERLDFGDGIFGRERVAAEEHGDGGDVVARHDEGFAFDRGISAGRAGDGRIWREVVEGRGERGGGNLLLGGVL